MIVLRINWNCNYAWRPNAERRTDPAWQQMRLEIFRRFTLPSLQNQTVADWQAWLICDPPLRDLTAPMPQQCGEPRLHVVYDLHAMYAAWRRVPAASGIDIFARIDSDDMLAPGALARWSEETEPGLVQFGNGYALDLDNGSVFEWNHYSSPFIADIGARQGPNLGGNHGQVFRKARRIDDRRWYMVTIHGDNVCNRLPCRWSGRQLNEMERTAVLAEFGIEL